MGRNKTDLLPVVKWAGGKEQELKYILPNLPVNFSRYIEPFVGGGAVYFATDCNSKVINDKSTELINLYQSIKCKNSDFIKNLENLQTAWIGLEGFLTDNLTFFHKTYFAYKNSKIDKVSLEQKIRSFLNTNKATIKRLLNGELSEQFNIFEKELFRNIVAKLIRMKELELQKGDLPEQDIIDNFECALKGSFYMFIRVLYNQNQLVNSHYFYFIREYCYSSMFRYNSSGEFNVPYGGISYNQKNFQRKIDYIKSQKLQRHFYNTDIFNLDFEKFLDKIQLSKTDFIFLDPPYDTDFSSYVNNSFDKEDQERLADYLIKKCPAKFMMVIKKTDFINKLYSNKGLFINNFDKTYQVSFKNRNNRACEHLLITNYPLVQDNVVTFKPKKQLQYATR